MSSQQVNSANAAARYGTALFELSSEKKSTTKVAKELNSLKKMLDTNANLAATFSSPLINSAEKVATIKAIAQKAKFSPLVQNFLAVVCENGRAAEISDMVRAFLAKNDQAKGTLYARAKSAQNLSAAQKKSLAAGLKKSVGRTVKLETELDPSLMGGLVVQIGSKMFDSSLKTQLEGLKLAMKES